jgi:hypothetical protein
MIKHGTAKILSIQEVPRQIYTEGIKTFRQAFRFPFVVYRCFITFHQINFNAGLAADILLSIPIISFV